MSATRELSFAGTILCSACDTPMTITYDAIGRTRERCPKCDRVAKPKAHHPDDAFVPQTLVRVAELPAVREGQLRCQRCARGVDKPRARFCHACYCALRRKHGPKQKGTVKARAYQPKRCAEPSCGKAFQPSGPRSLYCEACR